MICVKLALSLKPNLKGEIFGVKQSRQRTERQDRSRMEGKESLSVRE